MLGAGTAWAATSTFTVPSGTTFAASTTYYLIIDASDGTLATTSSDSEDSGGVTGWSIADLRTRRAMVSDSGLGGTWETSSNSLKIAVEVDHKGTVTACSAASMDHQVWTGTLTVGTTTIFNTTAYGWNDGGAYRGSNLTDTGFDFDSQSYGIGQIRTGGGTVSLGFTTTASGDIATQATRNSLVLHIGNNSFNFGA